MLAILSSGGDAPGMNTAIAAATKVAAAAGVPMLGVLDGYDGLIDGRWSVLTPTAVETWAHRGGTELGSARSARFLSAAGRAQAAAQLRAQGVTALLVIGGNGSLTGADRLAEEQGVAVVGLPASIDHDLACTGAAIGVDTALNTIVEACDRLSDTARSHRRAFVVEVMGRQCGYLAMAAAIAASADAVLYRESGKPEDQLIAELTDLLGRCFAPERDKKRVLILKAEGVEIPTERLVARLSPRLAEAAPGASLRSVVLGHVVRGGAPSFRDRLVAARLGHAAVWAALAGHTQVMAGYEASNADGVPTPDPSVKLFPLRQVLHETAALLDGTHPVTRRRVQLLQQVQGVLPL